jgi:hypothetical protein
MRPGRVAVTYVRPESIYESTGNRYAAKRGPEHYNYREDTATRFGPPLSITDVAADRCASSAWFPELKMIRRPHYLA